MPSLDGCCTEVLEVGWMDRLDWMGISGWYEVWSTLQNYCTICCVNWIFVRIPPGHTVEQIKAWKGAVGSTVGRWKATKVSKLTLYKILPLSTPLAMLGKYHIPKDQRIKVHRVRFKKIKTKQSVTFITFLTQMNVRVYSYKKIKQTNVWIYSYNFVYTKKMLE